MKFDELYTLCEAGQNNIYIADLYVANGAVYVYIVVAKDAKEGWHEIITYHGCDSNEILYVKAWRIGVARPGLPARALDWEAESNRWLTINCSQQDIESKLSKLYARALPSGTLAYIISSRISNINKWCSKGVRMFCIGVINAHVGDGVIDGEAELILPASETETWREEMFQYDNKEDQKHMGDALDTLD